MLPTGLTRRKAGRKPPWTHRQVTIRSDRGISAVEGIGADECDESEANSRAAVRVGRGWAVPGTVGPAGPRRARPHHGCLLEFARRPARGPQHRIGDQTGSRDRLPAPTFHLFYRPRSMDLGRSRWQPAL